MESIELPVGDFNNEHLTPDNLMDALEDNARGKRRKKRKKRRAQRKKRKTAKKAFRKKKKSMSREDRIKARKALKFKRKEDRATRKGKSKKLKKLKKRKKKAMKRAVKQAKRRDKVAAVKFAPLIPLKPVMMKALERRGKKPSRKTPISEVTKLFYNEIIVKKGNFEAIPSDYDFEQPDHIAGSIATGVVNAVITFIKDLKKKKEDGKELTKTEEAIVKGTEKVEGQIEEKAKQEAATEVGGRILFDRKTQLIIAGAVAVVALIAVKMFKK